jgi:hypothetical protein
MGEVKNERGTTAPLKPLFTPSISWVYRDVQRYMSKFITKFDRDVITIAASCKDIRTSNSISFYHNCDWIRRGYFKLLQWRFVAYNQHAIMTAFEHGHLEIARWLRQVKEVKWPQYLDAVLATHGDLQGLIWLESLDYRDWDLPVVLTKAICYGHLDIVQWGVEERGCKLTMYHFFMALSYPNYPILEFLHSRKCPVDFDLRFVYLQKTPEENTKLAQWLQDHGYHNHHHVIQSLISIRGTIYERYKNN